MSEEDSRRVEEDLSSPDELTQSSLTLMDLANALDIPNPNQNQNQIITQQHQGNDMQPPPSSLPPPLSENGNGNGNSSGAAVGSGGDDPPKTQKRQRFVWTPELHKKFVDAVEILGGTKAIPKDIIPLMNVDGLTLQIVASYLQRYRRYMKDPGGIQSGGSSGSNGGLYGVDSDHFMPPYVPLPVTAVTPTLQLLQPPQLPLSFPPLSINGHENDNSPGDESNMVSSEGDERARPLKRQRLVWTPELHKRFVDVVAHLGGQKATPKAIMELMNVTDLTRENVASHLQKYRLYLRKNDSGGSSGVNSATDRLFASSTMPANFMRSDLFMSPNTPVTVPAMQMEMPIVEPHVHPDQHLHTGEFGNSFLSNEEIEQRPDSFFTRLLLDD